jgi:hypothetical protein
MGLIETVALRADPPGDGADGTSTVPSCFTAYYGPSTVHGRHRLDEK